MIRITVTDRKPRFQVPIDIPSAGQLPSDPLYDVVFTSSPTFGIRVVRRGSGELILGQSSFLFLFLFWNVKSLADILVSF